MGMGQGFITARQSDSATVQLAPVLTDFGDSLGYLSLKPCRNQFVLEIGSEHLY